MSKQCLVCKKTSNGMHFGAQTCRACAAFFRRAVVLNLEYSCKTGDLNCNIDGRGRFVCRHCRLSKCHQIGMQREKVQLDYDPTYSIRMLCEDSRESNSPSESSSRKSSDDMKYCRIEINPDMTFRFETILADREPRMQLDFTDLSQQIEDMFSVKSEYDEGTEMEKLKVAMDDFRMGQRSALEVKIVDQYEIPEVIDWLKSQISKWATWFTNSPTIMSLPFSQKLLLFRSSWNIVRIFERLDMTSKIFENRMLSDKIVLMSEDLIWKIDHSSINFESISQLTNQYFQNLFEPYLNRYIEDVGKQMIELNLTSQELVFCLVNLIGNDSNWN